MRGFAKLVHAIKEGDHIMIPGAIAGKPIMYLLERQAAEAFRFVIVNTDPLWGLAYHEASAQKPPKIM